MNNNLKENKYEYILTGKPLISTCSRAVKRADVQRILRAKVIEGYACVSNSNYKPVLSNLPSYYSALIGNTVSIAIEIIGDLHCYGEYKGDFGKELRGIEICKEELDNKYKSRFLAYKKKVLEFKKNRRKVTIKTMGNLFDYVLYMAIFEKIFRGQNPNSIFNINESIYPAIIDEVKVICRLTYKDFILPNEENIKKSYLANPVFGTSFSGIKADGDFMIGNNLYDLKTKKVKIPTQEDMCQLALYYLLSRCKRIFKSTFNLELTQEDFVDKLYIYNTRYAKTYEIKVKKLTDIEIDEIMGEIYTTLINNLKK